MNGGLFCFSMEEVNFEEPLYGYIQGITFEGGEELTVNDKHVG